MSVRKKIKVLVIDDSLLFRETVAKKLAEDPDLEVVGTAADPFSGRDKIIELEPDVLTLDVEMPRMNGIEFLRRLMPQYPLPVVMLSSVDSRVFEALEAGAVDFVKKPGVGKADRLDAMIRELCIKVKIASSARLSIHNKDNRSVRSSAGGISTSRQVSGSTRIAPSRVGRIHPAPIQCAAITDYIGKYDLIAIGASTGGTEAVERILKRMPQLLPPIVIVQHMPVMFTKLYADRLNHNCCLRVQEAINEQPILEGNAVVAAGEHHLTVVRRRGRLFVQSNRGEKESGHCPSVDRMFDSIAQIPNIRAIGILLTGMGQDGARGLLQLKRRGFPTIGQDEASSVVYGMPKVAFELGAVDYQRPLDEIADCLLSILVGD